MHRFLSECRGAGAAALVAGMLLGPAAAPLCASDVTALQPPGSQVELGWYERQKVRFQNRNLMQKAQEALNRQAWAEAEELLRKALRNDPHNNYIKVSLVNCYYNLEQWDEGIFLCDALIRNHPDYLDAHFYKAYMAMRAGRTELAIEAFERLLEKVPASLKDLPANVQDLAAAYQSGEAQLRRLPEVYRSLAQLYLDAGNVPRAEEYAESWSRVDDSVMPHLFLAECAIRQERWDRATSRLHKAQALAVTPRTRGEIALKKGYIFSTQGDLRAAEQELLAAEDLLNDPAMLESAHAQLAEIAMREGFQAYETGDMRAAGTALEKALGRVQDDERRLLVQRQLGQVELRQRNYVAAADLFDAALEQAFDEASALGLLQAVSGAGQWERTAAAARGFLGREDTDPVFRRSVSEYLMRSYDRTDDPAKYYAVAAELREAHPDHAPYLLEQAVAAKRMARVDESLALYRAYLEASFDPRAALDMYYLAKLSDAAVDAEPLLKRIIAHDAADEDLVLAGKYELAQVYRHADRREEYLALMDEVVRGRPEADLLFEYGVQLYGYGQPLLAMEMFEKSYRKQTDAKKRFTTCKIIANIHFSRSEYEQAEAWLAEALKHAEADLEWHLTSGRIHYAQGRYEEAIDELLTQDPDHPEINMLLGFCFYRIDYPGLALYHFNRIEDPSGLQPSERATFFANRAHLNFDQDRPALALEDAQAAIVLRPSLRLSLVGIKSLVNEGRLQEAIDTSEALREAMEAEEVEAELRADFYRTLGRAYFSSGLDLATDTDKGGSKQAAAAFQRAVDAYTTSIANNDNQPDIYYMRAIALTKLEEFDLAVEDFEAMRERAVSLPGVYWGDLAAAQGYREEYEAGTDAIAQSVEIYPYDIDALEEAGYQFVKWKKNDEALEQMARVIELSDMILPYVDEEELERYIDDNTFIKREYAQVDVNWGGAAYVYRTEFGDDDLEAEFSSIDTIEGALASQLGAEFWWRPPKIGFRDHRMLDAFVRFLANFEPNSWTPDEDTYQLGVGLRYKPFKTKNYRVSIERLIAIGDAAEDNWLWRNSYALEYGEKPKKTWEWQWNVRTYFEASYYLEDPKRWVYFVDLKTSPTANIGDVLLVNAPQLKLVYRHQTDDPTGIGSYIYYGGGFEARLLDPEWKTSTERYYLDIYAHYVIGEFTDEPVRIDDEEQDFEGVIFGLSLIK